LIGTPSPPSQTASNKAQLLSAMALLTRVAAMMLRASAERLVTGVMPAKAETNAGPSRPCRSSSTCDGECGIGESIAARRKTQGAELVGQIGQQRSTGLQRGPDRVAHLLLQRVLVVRRPQGLIVRPNKAPA
jgi:hypothetical protein